MLQYNDTVAALIGSRICHDLISPIGAVANGIELMALSGVDQSPEMDLVAASAANANARICLFRLAFGMASAGQRTGAGEIRTILKNVFSDSRITVDWQPDGDFDRAMAQAALLALLCAESAVGLGGEITVSRSDNNWKIYATGPRLKTSPDLWAGLTNPTTLHNIAPGDVQFIMLPDHLARLDRFCRYTLTDTSVSLEF
ncbi:FIG118788: Signal transduction histidine kinase [hydrothermal vent metagenome]|uniref:FIG118788: Signal transduction histidine kinase n=1 Tax=hydrothermal vent metagenome TaxID=652676 RepID=A0A3B0RCM4_9ZZZZ